MLFMLLITLSYPMQNRKGIYTKGPGKSGRKKHGKITVSLYILCKNVMYLHYSAFNGYISVIPI